MHSKEQNDQTVNTTNSVLPNEIIIGTLVNIDSQGQPLVDYPDNPDNQPLVAISTLVISRQQKGRQVALLFANGNPEKPVIMGLIHNPLNELIENFEESPQSNKDIEIWPQEDTEKINKQTSPETELQTTIDGKRIVLEGQEEIVLKCGDACIKLTKDGKITIQGNYILNRSSSKYIIQGVSVKIN